MWVLAFAATVTIATPKHWKVTKADGAWTYAHKGATLVIRATAHDDPHPLDLDGALHDLLATVSLDAMDEVAQEERDGFPTWFVFLAGKGRLGAAGVIDAGPVTITYVLDTPAARFAADAEVLAGAIESVRVDGAEGPWPYPKIFDGVYGAHGWWLHFHDDGSVEQASNEDDLDELPKHGTWKVIDDQLHLTFADGTFATYAVSGDEQTLYLDDFALQRQ